ncbi:MAG: cell division protein FtsX [Moraxellaceae bacterium]|jgi:cell division transport system permease protein|nr:cell division protein FtsX [Moraxellaceae bacterium]
MSGAQKSRQSAGSRLTHWREHHAREAKASLRRLASTPLSTLMTLLVVALALSLPSSLYLLLGNAQQLTTGWGGQAQISLYLHQGLPAERQQALRTELGIRTDVSDARLITSAQALEEFRSLSGYGGVLDLLDSNPLPAVIVVTPAAIDPAGVERLRDSLAALPEVDAADIDLAWVQRLAAILELGQRLLWALAGALGATVLLVIGNTIRLEIEARKDEVRILSLLGATDAFVRRPFLYSGLWTGLLGGALACIAVAAFFIWLDSPVQALASLYQSPFQLQGPGLAEFAGLLGLSSLLGILGAWLAVGRHQRAVAP